ncbi:dTDP-glucose pyrophosphorylase [Microcoleus sp. FACHB-1515]|uniref:sugar phosphate nucleotidyltransferase n=1 Tax=Cyanophyceae TaxID=3028117 RepID=UPI001686DCAD|nr:sugar phosphate nucleotidyltransferase [Microcoleus sp. FACHB-1515]MBD2088445.1 dTDP-glucose pyrophosphorylase [Microcoleus sp. FACHB-1515]
MTSLDSPEIIALLPAGGQATRLAPLPLSKELYPIGFSEGRPKVVAHYLLEKMQRSGVHKAFFILKPGKWDIPAYFGDGAVVNLPIGYLTVHVSHGVPYTIDQAYPFVQNAIVVLGFPDILFQPEDAYAKILDRLVTTQADVVLGLFPTEQFNKAGMVEFDCSGQVLKIIEKPQQTDLKYMWAIAAWSSRFTEFLHEYLRETERQSSSRELPIGDVIQAAIDRGFVVQSEVFPEGSYLDIGTPEDLKRAIQMLTR